MNPTAIFNDLISSIENSRLNYMINKTPFSATISIKNTFIKRFEDSQDNNRFETSIAKAEAKAKCESFQFQNSNVIEKLKVQDKLFSELNVKLAEVQSENKNLEHRLNEEKAKYKASNNENGGFRDELLKIKSEKKNAVTKLKSSERESEKLRNEAATFTQEIEYLNEALKNKEETSVDNIKEVSRLKKEKECSEMMIENMASEINKLKDNLIESDTCDHCGKKFKPGAEFKAHVKEQHARSQGSQSNLLKDIDEETVGNSYGYKCFYCDTTIDSEQHLKEHKKVCHHLDKCSMITVPPCAICDAKCRNAYDLNRHISEYHKWTTPQFLCNLCPTNFAMKESLQQHRSYSHGISGTF